MLSDISQMKIGALLLMCIARLGRGKAKGHGQVDNESGVKDQWPMGHSITLFRHAKIMGWESEDVPTGSTLPVTFSLTGPTALHAF